MVAWGKSVIMHYTDPDFGEKLFKAMQAIEEERDARKRDARNRAAGEANADQLRAEFSTARADIDALVAALTARQAEVERLRAERDHLRTALAEAITALAEAIDFAAGVAIARDVPVFFRNEAVNIQRLASTSDDDRDKDVTP